MWFRSKRVNRDPAVRCGVAVAPRRSPKFGPRAVEALEDRALMSQVGHHHMLPQPLPFTRNFTETNLVTDKTGQVTGKPVIDPNLVNPWGIAFGPTSPFWVADNGMGVSTLYDGAGKPQPPPSKGGPLVVTIPTPGDPLGASGAPTGTVFNIDGGATGGFTVSGVDKNGKPITASAVFLFATEDGTLIGWNPAVNPKGFDPAKAGTYAIIAVDNSGNNFTEPDPAKQTGAVYKGLAQASMNGASFLYATNFRSGHVDVFDSNFNLVDLVDPSKLSPHAFQDPNIPNDFAPFGIQTINGNLYVTYAKQDAAKHDDVAAVGNGFVDVYAPNGKLLQRVAAHGTLDSPWGLAVAPAGFGRFSGALLVGNFGNSHVNAFDLRTDKFLGQLTGTNGKPLVLNGGFKNPSNPNDTIGLWGIAFDNGVPNGTAGSPTTLYFTAGINDEADGLFGEVTPASM